ncbi:MAG: DinB family protein [candidate division Zixibacteria bacterium]|nr:DinB family protein [candidate division Zixibacteria bacterium]
MTETERILEQLKRSFYKEAWHGPAFLEILEEVTAEQASKRSIAEAHSIWEIVLHTKTWIEAVRIRCLGKEFNVSDEQDWPKVTVFSDEAWQQTIAYLKDEHKKLEDVIASMGSSDFDKNAAGSSMPNSSMLDSIIHHNIYHSAQIAILKKLV